MLYNYNGDTFKIKFCESSKTFKVYHKAENKWSRGWTFVGKSNTEQKAQNIAKIYAS